MNVSTAHAVTPTDSRDPRGARHPMNIAHRETSARVMNLAFQIADAAVRSEIESAVVSIRLNKKDWFCTNRPVVDEPDMCGVSAAERLEARSRIDKAVRYIGLRSPDAFPWRFVRHPERPELVRFEDTNTGETPR